MARIRTIDFLPEIFQTPTNKEFLAATLDQVVNPPSTTKIQGYIGSKLGYGINAKDYYVPEPTKTRTDYQLEPGVVFQKAGESTAKDFISYPGILDAISIQHGITDDDNRLFNGQFYSWDSFCDFDKLVNYNQYYWLPEGPPVVNINSAYVYYSTDYVVTAFPNGYSIRAQESSQGSTNPTITLLRGGTYNFYVNQDTQFWIQGEPGVTGYSSTQTNLPVRNVYGVDNNGASNGVVTFNVPASNAQGEYDFAVNNSVDVVATVPFSQINGQLLSTVGDIDGVTGLEGLRVVFYDTGIVDEQGYINSGYGEVQYDTNDPAFSIEVPNLTIILSSCDTNSFTLASGNTDGLVVGQTISFNNPSFGGVVPGQVYFITSKTSNTIQISTTLGGTPLTLTTDSGSMIANVNQGLLEDGFYTSVNATYYRIQYLPTGNNDPVLRLVPDGTINELEKITPNFGTVYANRPLYRDSNGYINLIPYITAPLTTLYYQDGTYPDRVGIIKIIDSNLTNTLNVETDILGHKQFTSSNGVAFTNGLKVAFNGDVIPTSYLEGEYYVEGVGTAIELIPVGDLVCPEKFTQGIYNPYDTLPYDIGDFEINLYLPVLQDYITIARNSYSRNAWSRSNRWFHIDVINKSAEYNSNPSIANIANGDNKAKRPIIEFYPNLQLFDTGIVGKSPIDFFDTKNNSALSTVPDSLVYYPDIQVYSTQNANIMGVTNGTSTTVVVPINAVYGNIQDTRYISDALNILPNNTQITQLTNDGTNYTLTVAWVTPQTIPYTSNISIVASANPTENYSLFPGARVVFSNDNDVNVRNKIYVAEYSTVTNGGDQVITLTLAEDGVISTNTQVIVYRGYNNQGKSFYFDGNVWKESQQKTQVNQAPLFDIFDKNGISLSDNDIYVGTSFTGTKLFSYKVGTGTSDTVLGFPIAYSSVSSIGDISFDVNINEDTFNYVQNSNPITENINIGYVYNYNTPETYTRKLGWETAVASSVQYQVFYFDYDIANPVTYLQCDIAALPNLLVGEKGWPRVRVFYNNVYQSGGHSTDDTNNVDFTYSIGTDTTTIQLINKPTVSTPIQVLVLSDQVSNTAYYQVPVNLTNNPLNNDLTTVNLGDIRNHYEQIFGNAPNTVGPIFGNNNYRDCGDLLGYGTQIIQNSASLVLPGAFLRTPYHNLFDSLIYNSREYITYKQQIVSTVDSIGFDQTYTPSTILDTALAQIAASKSEINSFFWSDMLPNGSPYISNTYVFNNGLDRSIFPLSTVYNFSSANYQGVLVYLIRDGYEYQLLKGIDYTISTDSPSLTIETDLLDGDLIRINEFNQTYGSYVPYTPSKLGLYPLFEPSVVLETDYLIPTYFIKGHDGSYTKLYGEYDSVNNVLIDFRDQALLEFEQRIYNNIKLSTNVPIRDYEVLPGYFRQGTATYTYDEFIEMYTPNFLDWVGQNRLDYKTQYFSKNNEYTYNYRNSANKLDNSAIDQGYWRGVYSYFYDTFAPNLTPWQMLGFSEMPTWWTSRYGPAPYTSTNLILWNDIENGYIYNNGNPYIVPELARPGLSQIIPVDSAGNLLSPFDAIVGNYTATTFQSEWKVGDVGPVELSYRRSSTWPFDLIKIFALTRPAEFFNYAVDLDNYKYNSEFNQYLVNDRSHLVVSNIEIYGDGTPKTSFINWIVDYEKQQGINSTTNITTMLNNIDVRLVYRMAGYSSKELMNFYVEKSSANSNNSSLLIPQESYDILLYENQPYDRIVFSSVIVQQNKGYWTVYGNSQNFAYFEILDPLFDGKVSNLSVENAKVKVAVNYSDRKTLVPYGTKFYNTQDLSQFLMSYGANLSSKGVVFDTVVNGLSITWDQMVLEFLYWSQQGWENGSIITLNPSAQDLVIDTADTVVQPLTLQQSNFLLNQNLYPIKLKDICVNRDGTRFHAHTINVGDSISYAQFNMSNFEHGVVFNNLTLFNDVIYSPVTGLKQDRIFTRGLKTAQWNGTVNAWGFILSQDNIQEYSGSIKYTKNAIVMYKNDYYTSLTIIEPSNTFDETKWKKISYSDVQFGLLPNPSTRAYESVLYYDIYNANLQQESDLLSFSLIGFRPRDYLQSIDLTDSAQIQVYQNLIKNKGTLNAVSAFSGANLPQGGIQYETYENWAIQNSNYGGVLNQNFVEFRVNQANMTGDPAIISLTDGVGTQGAMQEVPIWQLYNYENSVTQANILQTTSTSTNGLLFPSAGYVNYSDVKMASYFYAQLPFAVNTYNNPVPIQNFYVGDYVWLANFKEKWNVFRWKIIGQVIQVRGNTNQTATVTFSTAHGLNKNDPMAIVNFSAGVDGYYLVTDVINLNEVIINLNLVTGNNNSIQGRGLGFAFESQRVSQPSDIANLNLIENEFIKNTVWVDTNTDGDWAVYQKSVNYTPFEQKTNNLYGTFGAAVAYTPLNEYWYSDTTNGIVYRSVLNDYTQTINTVQTINGSSSFGTSIAYNNNVVAVSQPTSGYTVKLYVVNDTVLTNQAQLIQTISSRDSSVNWGNKIAFSDDGNWLYISALDKGNVYVYQKQNIPVTAGYLVSGETYVITTLGTTDFTAVGAIENKVGITFVATGSGSGTGAATQITYSYVNTIAGTSGDLFGSSIATNIDGSVLVVGAPYYGSQNDGSAYAYARTVQNFLVPNSTLPSQNTSFSLAWTPNNLSSKTGSVVSSNFITLNNVTSLSVNMPIMLIGTNNTFNDFKNTGLMPYVVYYIHSIVGSTIKIKSSRNSSTAIVLTNATGLSFSVYPQNNPMFVSVNGNIVTDNNYAVVGNMFYYLGTVIVGDIINVSDNRFNLVQQFSSSFTSRIDAQFGTSVDITKLGADIVVGSPYEINDNNVEGAVYSYINGSAKYGYIIGTNPCNVTTNRTVLINGFAVNLTTGNATSVAQQINNNKLINIQAAATSDNKLMIQLINNELSPVEQKLIITAFSSNVLTELGLQVYTNTQIITSPHGTGPTQFGTTVKLNNNNGLLVSSPVGTRFEGTFFDFTDDANLDNDTLFDNNATGFVEQYPNAGAAYIFEYLSNNKESLNNPGKYVYAQDVIDTSLDYGYNPGYGLSLDFNNNVAIVGSPNYQPVTVGGKVVIYNNITGQNDWAVYRQSSPVVDIEKIQNTQLFSATTNQTLVNFDYPDPLQNKLLGVARENIDFISSADPAKYNVNYTNLPGMIWGAEQVGKIWFDTTNVRWMNYHQNDVVYNSRHWAMVFPGSDVAVYTWISSYILPVNYQGPGVPYDVNQYVIGSSINSSGLIVPVYYFWVRNTNIIFEQANKTLSDTVVASYIINPIGSGVSFMAPLLPNTFAMYNSGEYFNGNDTIFHIGYSTGTAVDVSHTEYSLIRENNEEDFLPGFPTHSNPEPHSLYAKMLDSLSGSDITGQVVPNPLLPKLVQQGILNVPRQSFFYDRTLALNNYISYANNILIQYPIVELRENLSFLFTSGDYYNTMDYWEYTNWWAIGYNNGTKTTIQVPYYADLSALTVPVNTLAKVEQNGAGKFEVYRYDGNSQWTRVGLENGTIQFKSNLWDYSAGKIGYSGNFFDTDSFDSYPSKETRNIVRALNEQIFVQELLIYRNKSLILLFEYIQAETLESQNYLTWLNKTSLVNVSHTIRELLPYEVYKTDDQAFLSSYINEVKPYHVVIKDFSFKYTKTDVYEGDITDFDLPSRYNSQYEQFISPQMVYTQYTDNEYQYNYENTIWNTTEYLQWYNNYGLSLGNPVYDDLGNITGYVGEPDYPITILSSYVTFSTKYLIVKNASGFPINGVIKIDDELIGYNNVDKATNVLSGLVRGVNNTPTQNHYPSTEIYIDLPAVILLSGGRGYANPPKVTAKIDTTIYPAPTVPAVLEAVMNLDSVLQIKVVNPGKGYAVLPDIEIEPGIVVTFDNTMVISKLHNIRVYAPNLRTGDLVQYKNNSGAGVGRLVDGEWYYINVLETTPDTIIGLYSTYSDAINDEHRIRITDIGTSTGMTLNVGAKAIAITQSSPVRENNIGLRFDRTSYQSKIIDWQSGSFYGAYYAGSYYNTDKLASTNITLESTSPNINDLLASAHGVVFEVEDVNIEETYIWSSFTRIIARTISTNNIIRLAPQDGNPSNLSELEPNASGSTIGLYKNMPIKFGGTTIGGIVSDQVYYVRDILNEIDFTISSTVDGPIVPISNATATSVMTCFTAQVSNLPILTVNYPGILNTVGTTTGINSINIPVSPIGTGGTIGFTPGTLLYFTATSPNEEIFGGLVENQVYYVNTVIDDQTFTVSRIDVNVATNIDDKPFTTAPETPVYSTSVSATSSTGNVITVGSSSDFALNDPVIFNQMIISGSPVNNFGNIVSGQLYYVSEVVSNTQIKITDIFNGATFALSNASGSMIVTNQKNVVQLATGTGLMTANVALPVSPGQVNGQKFGMYTTSQQYPNITAPNITIGTLLSATTYASIATVNRLAVNNTDWFYTGMPVQLQSTIGGLSASTTYYIKDYTGGAGLGPISVICDNTSSTGNLIHVTTDTSSLFVNMPITFTGVGLGNIVVDQQYYVKTIADSTHFTISETIGGATFVLQNDSGGMTGTGVPYITLSATPSGSTISLTAEVPVIPVTLNQIILSNPTFDISYILGGYRVVIQNGGSGFAITNTISISGSLVGGSSPANDLVLEVNTINGSGAITSAIISGTPNSLNRNYYFKIRGSNQFEVYLDSLMTIPANGDTFPYVGFTTTIATSVTASNDYITVTDTSMFNQYDPVVFTGTMFSSDIVLGQTYYIKSIVSSTQLTISATPNGTALNITSDNTGSMTIAKAGSFAFLSEPFYFNPSIIRFNNRLYNCLVSNNDLEFVIGKWQLIDSGNRRINALDRVVGYYQPTVNMPGKDLTQLFEGLTYPNSTYKGNAFEPALQFDLDTILQDQAFYPTNVDLTGIVYNNGYYASANLPDYSSVVYSPDGVNWINAELASSNINLTDIIYANGLYIITSQNTATPIYISTNGRIWSTSGTYTPWGSDAWDTNNYDSTSINVANISLQSATYFNGAWIAVGDNIVRSTDGYSWNEVLVFPFARNYQLYGVAAVQTAQFTGVVAVGKATDISLNPVSLICYSSDGINWNIADVTSSLPLYSVTSDGTTIIAAGQNGVLFDSLDAATWYGINQGYVTGFNIANNIISTTNVALQINQRVQFSNSFSSVVAGTNYYVNSIISPTLITISPVAGGLTLDLTAGSVPANTIMYSYDGNDINNIIYSNGTWVSVGENGNIKTSSDGFNYTVRTSNTNATLNNVSYVSDNASFVVVGDNNTILTSYDNGVTWTNTSIFGTVPAAHIVKGADFQYGYGPEELVAGVVRDNLALTVNTRPGGSWPSVTYANNGYAVISNEVTPINDQQKVYFFGGYTEYPAQVFVQKLSASTGLGTTLTQGTDYTVNWLNKTITLTTPLTLVPLQKLRIDVYEVGNGDQLVKSNTDVNPIRINDDTGFNEIYLDCNFTGEQYQGSGIVMPGTYEYSVNVSATQSITNRITVDSVTDLTLGAPITFSGTLFGGISSSTTYFIKYISYATNTITISLTFDPDTGVAGPEVILTSATGSMNLNLSAGSQVTWTSPIIYNNGTKLVQGYSSQITSTASGTNYITTDSTAGMVPGCKIIFSNSAFGGITPLTTYYVKQVVGTFTFTISATPLGSEVVLTTSDGGATYITYDYAFGIQPNGIAATLLLAGNTYTNQSNYIVYAMFGQTTPQLGYTVPETQSFVANGSTSTYNLTNNVDDVNAANAIVERNGLRLTSSQYSINASTDVLTITSTPSAGDVISITTFNDASEQYLNTQFNVSGTVTAITNVNNNIAPITTQTLATASIASTDGTRPNQIVCDSTTDFVVGQRVVFKGTSFGGISTSGTVYYVNSIVDSTHFTIRDYNGNIINLTTGSGSMVVRVGGQPSVIVTTSASTTFTTNTIVRIDGLVGSTQLNNGTYYVRVVTPTTFELYSKPYTSSSSGVNYPITDISSYVSGGYIWVQGQYRLIDATASRTYAVSPTYNSSTIVVADTGKLISGTPIYFSRSGYLNGASLTGGLVQGTVYYVKNIYSGTEFSISTTQFGSEMTLTDGVLSFNAKQWNQTNVDRLWVTVNGTRVPSSKLRLNDFNELSILTSISSGNTVIITSMTPSATPNQEIYINFVDDTGAPTVYRAPADSRTWLTENIYPLSTTISVDDLGSVVNKIVQTSITPALVNGVFTIGLTVDKRSLISVTVYNNDKQLFIPNEDISIMLSSIAPSIDITSGSYIDEGDSLTITSIEGNTIFVNGEQINFTGVDFDNSMLTGISRGVNGTGEQSLILKNTTVYSLMHQNKLSDVYYNQTWNSNVYNTEIGDPLQISTTVPALFLNVDNS